VQQKGCEAAFFFKMGMISPVEIGCEADYPLLHVRFGKGNSKELTKLCGRHGINRGTSRRGNSGNEKRQDQ